MKTLRNADDILMFLLLTLNRFHTFSKYFILEFGKVLPAGFTSGDQRAETEILWNMEGQVQNYAT